MDSETENDEKSTIKEEGTNKTEMKTRKNRSTAYQTEVLETGERVSKDSAGSTNAINGSQAQEVAEVSTESNVELLRKLKALQEKTGRLRSKIDGGFTAKRTIEQQQNLVQNSEVVRMRNDVQAAVSMKQFGVKNIKFMPPENANTTIVCNSTGKIPHNYVITKKNEQGNVKPTIVCNSTGKIPPNYVITKKNEQGNAKATIVCNSTGKILPNYEITKKNEQGNDKTSEVSSNYSMDPNRIPNQQFDQQQNQPANMDQIITTKKKRKAKARRELEEQLQDMRDLLLQLTARNPPLKAEVQQLVLSNEKYQKLFLFDNSVHESFCHIPNRELVGLAPQANLLVGHDCEQSVGSSIKKRRQESLVSASNVDSLLGASATGPSTAEKNQTTKSEMEIGKNKEQKKKRRKRSKLAKSKTQQGEHEALLKYLIMIVEEFLGEKEAHKLADYTYKPDEEDLETYAQRLTQAGLGRIVEEEIRINRKNNRQSFITFADRESSQRDGIVLVPVARRYAFEGDIVRAFIMNSGNGNAVTSNNTSNNSDVKSQTKVEGSRLEGGKGDSLCEEEDPFADETEFPDYDVDPNDLDTALVSAAEGCPKAFVIKIIKQTEKREVVGTISFRNTTKLNDDQSYYKLKPHDMRMPMIYVSAASCDKQITSEQKNDVCGFLYVVKVRETNAHGYCIGELFQPVGKVGNMEAEIRAILLHNCLKDVRPYEERFNEMFAQPDPPISAEDLTQREDLRHKCIFTIDPLTARDLDDAVSIDLVDEGVYEVGVHISDVTHYLHEDTELDNIVKVRATSIYLVNEVIHMLPQPLCLKCSLLPGEDKFAFSVLWRMKLDGSVVGEPRFTRSVINSCSQLAYEHAQKLIDNFSEVFDVDDFPTIYNGFNAAALKSRIFVLNKIAKCLRSKRYEGGALSINNPKLCFTMDPRTGEPLSYEVDAREEANFLIEEFMLLANQAVARFIYNRFPENAILRHHDPPLSNSLKALKEKLANLGIDFDCRSSKAIQESMQRICARADNPKAMYACLSTLLTKPMARAKYFCSEGKDGESDFWHYGLSVPIYTHFTSPIRRYPDILVHRLLAAALNYCPPPKRTTDELHHLAKICNDQKYNAKNASEESSNLFFKRYIKSKQSVIMSAVVMEIFQHIVNVVLIETGHVLSINYRIQKVLVDISNVPAFISISEQNSKNAPLHLRIFSAVDVKVVVRDDKLCGFFVSPDPKQRILNSIQSTKKRLNSESADAKDKCVSDGYTSFKLNSNCKSLQSSRNQEDTSENAKNKQCKPKPENNEQNSK